MVTLTTIDYIFSIAYFLLVMLIAYIRTRKAKAEEFLIAGRKLGVLSSLSSINATKTGSVLLVFVALLYLYGASAMWYFIGVAVGYLIFIPFAVRLHKRHGARHYTLADYFFHDYGKTTGRCASVLNIFVMISFLVLNLIASSKVLSFFTGLSFEWATIIVMAFVLVYLLLGGFKAVVTTDVLQYIAMVFILLMFAFFMLKGVSIPASEWAIGKAGITNIIGFFLIGILFPFAAPDLWQRVYAVKNLSVLKKSIFWSVIVYLAVGFILTLIGLAIKTALPGVDPDIALIEGFAKMLPVGLIGLALIVFFAAFMSSIDTYAYTASSSFIQDFFRKLKKATTVKGIRISIFAIVIIGTLVAIAVKNLVLGTFMFAGYLIVLAIPTIATWIKPKIKSTTLNIALIFGMVCLTLLMIWGVINKSLTPMLVIHGVGLSILGLIIGAIYSKFFARK